MRDLGTERLRWEDLRAIVTNAPPDSAFARARGDWTLDQELSAASFDVLNWLAWSKTRDGQKNRKPPKPIPRPSNNFNMARKGRMAGALSLPVDEVARRLALPRREARPVAS